MNYKRIPLFFIFAFIGLLSFAQSPVVEVKINPQRITKGDLMLTDLAASIDYIPLETRDDCLIGYISFFDISPNFIVVYCYQSKAVYLFKRNGQFVKKIGDLGQGPSEYIDLNSIYLDEANKQILLCDYAKILYFSLEGKFLHSKAVFSGQRMYLAYFNEQFLTGLFSGVYHDSTYHVYNIIDREGKLLTKGVNSVMVKQNSEHPVNVATFVPPILQYTYEGAPNVMEITLNDTIYRITSEHKFIPKYVLNAGTYAITPAIRANTNSYFDTVKDYVALRAINETKDYILILFSYKEKDHYCYYHKKTGTIHSFDSSKGIPNDYDGYFDFWAKRIGGQKSNKLYMFYDAHDFLAAAEQKKHDTHAPKEAMQKLQTILKKTNEDDNPVLLILTLK